MTPGERAKAYTSAHHLELGRELGQRLTRWVDLTALDGIEPSLRRRIGLRADWLAQRTVRPASVVVAHRDLRCGHT